MSQTTTLAREQARELAMEAMRARGFPEREAAITVEALLDALPPLDASRLLAFSAGVR